jgi:UDP-2,4-diacetamido-2,4,6-trideoxy-beta-L-altropyranose hydrolase
MLRIAIRVDASRAMSLGHLTRCLTLADALRVRGAEIVFLCAPSIEDWRDMIADRGHALRVLELAAREVKDDERGAPAHADWLPWGWRSDAEATLAALVEMHPVEQLVVDHYALDERWEQAVRAGAPRIIAVDDLADRRHDCDLLLDHNAQDLTRDRYADLVPPAARRLIGPRYALLRPQFAAARGEHSRDGGVGRALVFMSATDAKGATLLALDALARGRLASIPVDIVIGRACQHLMAIEARAAERGQTTVHVDTTDMAVLCSGADLAIGAGGVAALERCCLGLPTITLSIAANQEAGLAALDAAGAVRHLGAFEAWSGPALAREIESLIGDRLAMSSLAKNAEAIVDGVGADRCAARIATRPAALSLRSATMDDARRLLEWRNDESVRLVSLNAALIGWSDHLAWLATKLGDEDHFHWIGESEGEACASVRFDVAQGEARVSIAVAPGRRGEGLGARLLEESESRLLALRGEVTQFVAEILPANVVSQRLFSQNGYQLGSEAGPGPLRFVKFARPRPA